MGNLQEFLGRVYFENTIGDYTWCVGIIIFALIIKQPLIKLISRLIHRSIKKLAEGVAVKRLEELEKGPLNYLIMLLALYIGVNQLVYPAAWDLAPSHEFGWRMLLEKTFHLALVFSITWALLRMVDFIGIVFEHRASLTESKLDDQLVGFLKDILKIFILVMSVFFALASVFEMNIATLIGGLGIGGLAVALAAKETLENLLGSVTIFLDKPFVIGDLVRIGEIAGHVETIGLRSTKIRTLEKSLISVPNKKMVDAELDNVTERTFWRMRFAIGVLYSTRAEDIRNIIDQSMSFITAHPEIEEGPLVKLDSFNSSSIDILYNILVKTNDWEVYMKVKEEVHFKIMEIVQNNNTDFAFPSTSVYMEKSHP